MMMKKRRLERRSLVWSQLGNFLAFVVVFSAVKSEGHVTRNLAERLHGSRVMFRITVCNATWLRQDKGCVLDHNPEHDPRMGLLVVRAVCRWSSGFPESVVHGLQRI
jgi:hypothetical protein